MTNNVATGARGSGPADELRLRRIGWRATHRGTREADMLVGGFVARWLSQMDEPGLVWLETLLDEQDVDIMAWAFRRADPPAHLAGPWMERLLALDYVILPAGSAR